MIFDSSHVNVYRENNGSVFSGGVKSSAKANSKMKNTNTKCYSSYAKICVRCLFNNTIITVTNSVGDTLLQGSSGMHFRNAKKSNIHAAQVAAKSVMYKAKQGGISSVDVVIRGIGATRDIVVRSIVNEGINVLSVMLCVNLAFNGTRPRASKKGS